MVPLCKKYQKIGLKSMKSHPQGLDLLADSTTQAALRHGAEESRRESEFGLQQTDPEGVSTGRQSGDVLIHLLNKGTVPFFDDFSFHLERWRYFSCFD